MMSTLDINIRKQELSSLGTFQPDSNLTLDRLLYWHLMENVIP